MRVLVKEHGSVISDLTFEEGPVHIGSQTGCAIHLPDMRVELRHAVLTPHEDGHWIVEPAEDNARTLVNGHQLRTTLRLNNGDQIGIGDYLLNIYLDLGEHGMPARDAQAAEGEGIRETPLPPGSHARSNRQDVSLSPSQIESFSRFALELAGCHDVSSLMEAVLSGLMQRFRSRASWVGVRRQGKGALECIQGRDFNGEVFETPRMYEALRQRCLERGFNVWIPDPSDERAGSIIAAPILSLYGRLGFIYVDSRKSDCLDEHDFEELIGLTSIIGAQLEAVIRKQVRWRREVSSAETSIVHAIQSKLDPKVVPEWARLQVAVHCSPGQEIAGDVYDIMQLPNGAAAFLVGQVDAPPVTAATTMVAARTAFRIAVLHSDMPHVMMQELNWLLCAQADRATMQSSIVMVDPNNGALLYSIAGDSHAVIIGQSGDPRHLEGGGAPRLGIQSDFSFATRKGFLGQGESLALFTPGVLNITDAEGNRLEESGFLESLCDGFGLPARKAIDETISDLTSYSQRGYQPMDLTLLLAHRGTELE